MARIRALSGIHSVALALCALVCGSGTALASPPPAAPITTTAHPKACGPLGGADVTLGPKAAPQSVQAWIDPLHATSLLTYVELRRLVADADGGLRIDIDIARGDGRREPPRDRVRTWALALARAGKLEHALREIARDGPARMMARLGTPAARMALAQDLAVDAALAPTPTGDRCVRAEFEHNTAALLAYFGGNPASLRLPVFLLASIPFDDAPTLDRLRPELGRAGLPLFRPAASAPTVPLQAIHADMRRPRVGGVVLGGLGLPHRFVMQARDEDDATLFMMLPAALKARRQRPGRLAVHVVARGSSTGAIVLRHRLCAARVLGMELAYLEHLGTPPPNRERPLPDVATLIETLDEVPQAACEDEPDPADLDLPDGQWLDGLPRARAELANLEATLALLARSQRPLTPLLGGHTHD